MPKLAHSLKRIRATVKNYLSSDYLSIIQMFLFILILKSEFWVKSQKGEKKKISLNYYLLIDISSSHKLCFLLSTPRGKQSCHDHSCEDLLKLNTISSSAGEGLRFQSRYLEFWDHGHWARHRGRTLSQIPANEGERSAERSNPSGNVWLMTQNKYKVSSSDRAVDTTFDRMCCVSAGLDADAAERPACPGDGHHRQGDG